MSIEFPTLVYRAPGVHHRAGGTYDYKGAQDAEQLDQLVKDGWFLSLPEAIDGKHGEAGDDDAPPTREEMEAKAAELGIKFDGRTTDKSLAEKIEQALAEQAKE